MRQVELTWEGGDRFIARGHNGYTFDMYAGEGLGGNLELARAKDLVLLGLAGCTAGDVASILTRMRLSFQKFSVSVSSEEAGEPPKVFRRMAVTYRLWGDAVPEHRFLRAIDLSWNKYCGVTLTLRPVVEMTWRAELNGVPVGPPKAGNPGAETK